MILAIVNHKGGVGRSTTAMMLGFAFARAGRRVVLNDVDPVGTVIGWADQMSDFEKPLPFSTYFYPKDHHEDWDLEEALPVVKEGVPEDAVLIFDVGPRDTAGVREVADRADFVLVPTQSSKLAFAETVRTLDGLTVPHAVVLTMGRQKGAEEIEYRQRFFDQGVYVCRTMIPYEPSIARLYGTVPSPSRGLLGYEELAGELESFFEVLTDSAEIRRRHRDWEQEKGRSLFCGLEARLSSPAYQRPS